MKEKDYRVEYLKEREARESLEKFIEDFYIRFCDLYNKFTPMGSVKDRIHNSGWHSGMRAGWNSSALFTLNIVSCFVSDDVLDEIKDSLKISNISFEDNLEELKLCDKCKGKGYLKNE